MDAAAKVLVASAIDLVQDTTIIENTKCELKKRLAGRTYQSLIPGEVNINRPVMEKYRSLFEKLRSDNILEKGGSYSGRIRGRACKN